MQKRAIIALTNGIISKTLPSESTILRLRKVAEIYTDSDLIITSTGYTVNKSPVLDENGFPVPEAVVASRYLVNEFAVRQDSILAETFSRDTIGNIFFTLELFLLPLGIRNTCIVTSGFHMKRVEAIFSWMQELFNLKELQVSFEAADNPDFSADTEKIIPEREAASLRNIESLKKRVTRRDDFVHWLFTEHKAYSFNFDPQPAAYAIQQAY
jgi:hypothetical protein